MPARLSTATVAALSLLLSFVFIGCHAKQPPPAPAPPPPADVGTLQTIREQMQAQDPTVRVGIVTSVLPASRLAEVKGVDVREFKENDAITFIDTAEHMLVNGSVAQVNGDALHVIYENPRVGTNQRAPREGDLAVHFKHSP